MIDLARFCDARLSALAFLIFSRWVGVKSHSDNLPGNTIPKGPPARMRSTYTSTAASVTGVFMFASTLSFKATLFGKCNSDRRGDCEPEISDLSLWCSPDNTPASHAGDHRSEAGQGRQFMPPKHCQRCIRSVSDLARCNSGWGLQFLGEWLSGNSRPHRSRICEPWRCKSSLAHQFQGVEATADRHRTFNPVW